MSAEFPKPSLLSKTNPRATRRSVIVHSLVGGCGGVVFWLVLFWTGKCPPWGDLAIVPFRAFIAGKMEWQLDDFDDEDDDCPIDDVTS